jgi:cytochrome oxidase Cu insertion factor (SCO1/SenC/PrrC family)
MAAATRRVIALALLGVLGAAGQPLAQRSDRSAAELMDAVMWNREPIGGPFALIDQDGRRRTDADFRGKVLLIYFGFSYCPDVCPADLQEIGLAVDRLGPAGDAVQPIFITLDPARDTPEHLNEYVAMFHARFVGLTGDAAAIDAAARRPDRRCRRDRRGRPRLSRLLRQGRAREIRLHRGPLRLHLSDGTAGRISRLFSARHARGHSCRHAEGAGRQPLARNECNLHVRV